MGQIFPGVPRELMLFIKANDEIDTFIESGTYLGATAFWASQHFSKVITIEASKELRDTAAQKYSSQKNIEFRHGNSPDVLADIVQQLDTPAIFWLDAHWSGGITYGQQIECPLRLELEIIKTSKQENIVLIDDASFFLSPPPAPHRIDAWPTISEIIKDLERINPNYYTVIWNDVIIALPSKLREVIADYFMKNQPAKPEQNTFNLKKRIRQFIYGNS